MQKTTSQEQLKEVLKAHARKVVRLIPQCDNEEQTKITLINPYLEHLGWDVRDPGVCRMEFAADYSTRKPEKVDYAIFHGGKVLILLEAKSATSKLPDEVPAQLQRYFQTQQAKYAVLTNGVIWKWYGEDPEGYPGKLHQVPFLVDDTRKVTDNETDWLYSVHPDRFNPKEMDLKARQSGAQSKVLDWFQRNLREPDPDFVTFLIGNLRLSKSATQENLSVMAGPVRNALNQVITDRIESSLDRARQSPVEPAREIEQAVDRSSRKRPPAPTTKPAPVKKEHQPLPVITEWVLLDDHHRFYPNGKPERGIGRIDLEVRLPDHTVQVCKGWRNLATQTIDWIDSQANGPQAPVCHAGGNRLFGNRVPEHPSGAKFLKPYRAEKMDLYFEVSLSAKDLLSGIEGLIKATGRDLDSIRLRSPRK